MPITQDIQKALGGLGSSPLLIVGAAGAAVVAVVWISSRNRPASEVVGGQLPISWDALQNWLNGRNGGPGPGPGGEPTPTEHDPNEGQPDPNPSPDPFNWDPGPIPIIRTPPQPRHECYGPDNQPMPCPPGPGSIYEPDSGPEEVAMMPNGIGGSGVGRPRILGYSPEHLYQSQYNLLWARASTEHREDHL